MTSDLETDIKATAHAGFRALELWAGKVTTFLAGRSVGDLAALLDEYAIEPMSINSLESISFRGDEYRHIRARCDELCQIAQAIDCRTVVVVPSPIPSFRITWGQIVQEHVRVLRDLGGIAARYQVRLAFELLGFGWCTVRTPRGAWEIVCQTGLDNVGLMLDCAHLYGGGGLYSELDAVDPACIFGFHLDDLEDLPKEAITDADRLLPGLGVIPLDEICRRLQRLGYDGDCSVELFRPEYWEWDPRKLAVEVRDSALKVLSPYFTVR